MKVKLFHVFLILFSHICAFAHNESSIVAIVNGDAILLGDLRSRIVFTVKTAQLDDSAVDKKELRAQLLNIMINEVVMRQVSAQHNIVVVDQDVEHILDRIAQQFNVNRSQLTKLLETWKVPLTVVTDHIKAQVGWQKFISERYRSSLNVAQKDVDKYKKQTQSSVSEPIYSLSEIYIPYDGDKSSAYKQALNLSAQFKNGANFAQIAQQVSNAANGLNGGEMGFLRSSQIPGVIFDAVKNLKTSQVSHPIEMPNAYVLVRVNDIKKSGQNEEVLLSFIKVSFSLSDRGTQADLETLTNDAVDMVGRAKSVGVLRQMLSGRKNVIVDHVVDVPLRTLHPELVPILMAQPKGQFSKPLMSASGVTFLALEDRKVVKDNGMSDADIHGQLMMQKLNQISMMQLRKIRQNIHIEIKN